MNFNRLSMDAQIQIGFEMSPIDEENSNLLDFSDLSKSNLQQSQYTASPAPAIQQQIERSVENSGRGENADKEKPIDENVEENKMEEVLPADGLVIIGNRNIDETRMEMTIQERENPLLCTERVSYKLCFDSSDDHNISKKCGPNNENQEMVKQIVADIQDKVEVTRARGQRVILRDRNIEETMLEETMTFPQELGHPDHRRHANMPIKWELDMGKEPLLTEQQMAANSVDASTVAARNHSAEISKFDLKIPDSTIANSPRELGGEGENGSADASDMPIKQLANADAAEPMDHQTNLGEDSCKQMASERKLERKELERQRNEALAQLGEAQLLVANLQRKLADADTQIDAFEELEGKMLLENFQLKKELLKLKVHFGLITIEEAGRELGCCETEFL